MALCSSHTLEVLVAELRERAVAGEPQESFIGWLASLVKGLGKKMRTDKCTAPQFFIRPSKMGRIMPCPLSVHPSVRLSVRPDIRLLTFRVCSITLIPFKIFS